MFVKHFVRMVTRDELSDEDVILFFDITQSVVATKLITAYDDANDRVSVDVIMYTSNDSDGDLWIYEIVLDEEIDQDEGDKISEELFNEFDDVQFTFEASVEM